MHGAVEAMIKLLYASSLDPDDMRAYIEAVQNHMKDLSLKTCQTW